ncbi:MAG TPA: hypothetical protein VIH16_03005, partial [Bellilinea sp.]
MAISTKITSTDENSQSSDAVKSKIRGARSKLIQAAELMRDIRLAQSLNQLIQVLTSTLPSLLEADVCGYLTWMQSPRAGVHWEYITGDNGRQLEQTPFIVDRATDDFLKSGE